eukprot:3682026-Prymnesium_polylepis.1
MFAAVLLIALCNPIVISLALPWLRGRSCGDSGAPPVGPHRATSHRCHVVPLPHRAAATPRRGCDACSAHIDQPGTGNRYSHCRAQFFQRVACMACTSTHVSTPTPLSPPFSRAAAASPTTRRPPYSPPQLVTNRRDTCQNIESTNIVEYVQSAAQGDGGPNRASVAPLGQEGVPAVVPPAAEHGQRGRSAYRSGAAACAQLY